MPYLACVAGSELSHRQSPTSGPRDLETKVDKASPPEKLEVVEVNEGVGGMTVPPTPSEDGDSAPSASAATATEGIHGGNKV